MACFKPASTIDLGARESLTLPDFRGTTLRVNRGTVWITQENDTQDIVLRAGDSWVVEKNGLTILEAQEASSFQTVGRKIEWRLVPSSRTPSWIVAVKHRLGRELLRFLTASMRRPLPYY